MLSWDGTFKHSATNNYHWFTEPKLNYATCRVISKDGKSKSTNQSQTPLHGANETTSGRQK